MNVSAVSLSSLAIPSGIERQDSTKAFYPSVPASTLHQEDASRRAEQAKMEQPAERDYSKATLKKEQCKRDPEGVGGAEG